MDIKKITYRIQYFNNFGLPKHDLIYKIFLLFIYTKTKIIDNSNFYFCNGCLFEDNIIKTPFIRYKNEFNDIYIDIPRNKEWFFVNYNDNQKKKEYMLDDDDINILNIIKSFACLSKEFTKELFYLIAIRYGCIKYLSDLNNKSYSKKQHIDNKLLLEQIDNFFYNNPMLGYKNMFKESRESFYAIQ